MNWLRMFRKVKGVFKDDLRITKKYKAIGTSFATFDGILTKIEEVDSNGSKANKGTYEDKINKKDEMAHEAVELASAASAYARDEQDAELLAVLDTSYGDIRYADEQTAYSLGMGIYNQLDELGPALEYYLVTAEDLVGLKEVIDSCHDLLENSGSQDSVARTLQLAGLFQQGNDHLNNHLDKLVTRIKRKEPKFYDTYQNACVIIDLGGGRKQKGTENDA